ncbi:MAG: hypothetical protein PWQ20_444 [Thermotogaceae bacterium]|nr:hypothetical protein [Thermotogaceae bacterium]MDN5337374.1 hypothetical protein [Thermotogaceae bacterium]
MKWTFRKIIWYDKPSKVIKVKKIFLFGFYGYGNLGDEILLEKSLRLLSEYDDISRVTVLSPKIPKISGENFKFELSNVSKYDFLKLLKTINSCDLVIGGGGGIFQDETSLRSFLYYSTLVKHALLIKKPVLLLAQSLGPLKNNISRRIMKKILQSDLVYPVMRDPVSYRYSKLFSKNTLLSADLAFEIDDDKEKGFQEKDSEKISLVIKEPINSDDFFNIIESMGFKKIDLLLFFPKEEEKIALKNLDKLRNRFEVSVSIGYNRIVNSIATSSLVVTQRLHGAILSLIFSTKFISPKNPKIVRTFIEFPYPGFTDFNSSFELVGAIKSLEKFDFDNYRETVLETFSRRLINVRKLLNFFLETKYITKNLIFEPKT